MNDAEAVDADGPTVWPYTTTLWSMALPPIRIRMKTVSGDGARWLERGRSVKVLHDEVFLPRRRERVKARYGFDVRRYGLPSMNGAIRTLRRGSAGLVDSERARFT